MTHDFATVSRYVESRDMEYKTTFSNTSNPLQLRWILLLVTLCSIVWIIAQSQKAPALVALPDQAASLEYQIEIGEVLGTDSLDDEPANPDAHSLSVKKALEIETSIEPVKVVAKVATKTTIAPVVQLTFEPVSEEYGFYDNLSTSQWAVQSQSGTYVDGELSKRTKSKYKLQAASFRRQYDAQRLVGKLAKNGLTASVHGSISTNGMEWYQVSVGPFTSVSKLNKAHDILVSLNMMPLKKKI